MVRWEWDTPARDRVFWWGLWHHMAWAVFFFLVLAGILAASALVVSLGMWGVPLGALAVGAALALGLFVLSATMAQLERCRDLHRLRELLEKTQGEHLA